MKIKQKIGFGFILLITALIIAGSFFNLYNKTYDIENVPSAVNWGEDVQDQIAIVRQSENFYDAQENLEKNNFPLRVLREIPKKASELNLPWANKIKEGEFTLFLFTAEKRLIILDESKDKKFHVMLTGFEPGFVVKYNNDYNYCLLESFTKVLNNKELTFSLYPLDNYWKQEQARKNEKKMDSVIKSVQFTDKFYPCSLYDDIDFWVRFAKEQDIKLLGRFWLPDSNWEELAYSEAQDCLEIAYVIALDLPNKSSYIKLQSGKEYIQTSKEKMVINLP